MAAEVDLDELVIGRADYPPPPMAIRAVMADALAGGEALRLRLVRPLVRRRAAAEPVACRRPGERMAGG